MKPPFGKEKEEEKPEWAAMIRAARGDQSQASFAAACDVSQNTISRWETGVDEPTKAAFALLAIISEEPYRNYFWEKSGFLPLVKEKLDAPGLLATGRDGTQYYTSKGAGVPPPPTTVHEPRAKSPERNIPLLPNAAATGSNAPEIKKYLSFPGDYLREGGKLWALEITEESFTHETIVVIVDTLRRTPIEVVDRRVAVRWGEEILIRWVRHVGKTFVLEPLRSDPSTPILEVRSKGDRSIIGEVAAMFFADRLRSRSRR